MTTQTRPFIPWAELAERLDCTVGTVRRNVRNAGIPLVKIRGQKVARGIRPADLPRLTDTVYPRVDPKYSRRITSHPRSGRTTQK